MDNNKKNGNWLTELLEELKLSLVISYLELFVTLSLFFWTYSFVC